jgi:dynein heavy chain
LQVRRYLHVVLCFSPVGDKFRIRARQFPALVNCTQLDWFHGWPAEALLSVATRFLADVPDVNEELRVSMAQYMAQAHQVGLWESSLAYGLYMQIIRLKCGTSAGVGRCLFPGWKCVAMLPLHGML